MNAIERFVTERVSADLPGATVDFDDDSEAAGGRVAIYGGHRFAVDLSDPEFACAHVAEQLQDDEIGVIGLPWPELVDARGISAGVLLPSAESGVACWYLDGEPWCAIGQLRGAAEAASFSVRNGH